jgi:parvulin-like peptidyl-prolyl isomerase
LESERVKFSQILLETEEKAVEVYNKVKNASEEEFRKMAGEVSAGPEASKGGEMGVFKLGELPFDLEKVIFSLAEGEISKVVESTYGFHIFRLDKRAEPELISAADAAPSIRVKILDQKIKDALSRQVEELKKTMDWQSFPHVLSFVYERNLI